MKPWKTASNGVELECRKCGRWTEGRAGGRPICRTCHETVATTPRAKRYRIQRRDVKGFVKRGWGFGRAMSYGPWATVATADTPEEARAIHRKLAAVGLYGWRIVHGKDRLEV